ncbi:RmlC-like cupin family protein [Heterostelium album PN500]|uniref:RmlC-like cupin family protein n=1 Tax=Heterostelium pallidum (strain ATCC 26659 / Pp 5 / PN500) TaxID=670386 RepID=D3B4P9_HETP5|nr:RmlC-like cupin family protein [Heterostelium album PN500]EFA84297.1 RmlC-like cupin family protein [Heterostelium album PN500]|eukprot:XP_020436413.1 RmlC-like cupin family protein [Heterostelium album PN500]
MLKFIGSDTDQINNSNNDIDIIGNSNECITFFKQNYKSIVADSNKLKKSIDYLYNNNNNNSSSNSNKVVNGLILDDCIQSSVYIQPHRYLDVLLMCIECIPTFKRQLLDQLTLVYTNHLHFQIAITDSMQSGCFKLRLSSPKYQQQQSNQQQSKKRNFESINNTTTNATTNNATTSAITSASTTIEDKSKMLTLMSSPQTKELRSSILNQKQQQQSSHGHGHGHGHSYKGYHLYKHYDEYILSIHEYMISLLDRNGQAWYLDIIQWILRTLTHLNQMVLLSSKSTTTSSTSNIDTISLLSPIIQSSLSSSNQQQQQQQSQHPSIILQNNLRYLTIRNLLSLLLHMTKNGIDHLFKQTKLLETPNQSWIVLFISGKYPMESIEYILNQCYRDINGNISGSGNVSGSGQLKTLEYLSDQFKEIVCSVVLSQLEDERVTPLQLLQLLYHCPVLLSIVLPVIINHFQSIFSSLDLSCIDLIKTILQDRNSFLDASSITRIITLLLDCINNNNNNNSNNSLATTTSSSSSSQKQQQIILFMSIVEYLEQSLFDSSNNNVNSNNQQESLVQGLSNSLWLFCQCILENKSNEFDFKPLVSLTTAIAMTSSRYCQHVLLFFLTKESATTTSSRLSTTKITAKSYILYFVNQFQVGWPGILSDSVNLALERVDSLSERDLDQLLSNILSLLLIDSSGINQQEQQKQQQQQQQQQQVLKSLKSKWYILLRMIEHQSLSIRQKSLEALQITLCDADFTANFKDLLDMRIFGERILNLIFGLLINFNATPLSVNSASDEKKEFKRIIILNNLKSLYKSICNLSLFNLSWGLALLLDFIMSPTHSDLKLKQPTTYVIHPANSAQSIILEPEEPVETNLILNPNIPLSQPLPKHHKQQQQQAEEEVEDIRHEGDEYDGMNGMNGVVMNGVNGENVPDENETLLQSNFKRKYYQYKFLDMNQPRHLPFKNGSLPNGLQQGACSTTLPTNYSQSDNQYQIVEMIKSLLKSNNNNNNVDQQQQQDDLVYINLDREKLSIFTCHLLKRVLPSHINPSYENYQEIMPKHSTFERDIYLRKLFQQDSILWELFEIISNEVVKSLLVNELTYWYSEKFLSKPSKSVHFRQTCTLVGMLANSKFIPPPLSQVTELLDKITPEEISFVLVTIWNFIRYHPPNPSQYSSASTRVCFTDDKKPLNVEVYTQTLKSIFHNHISELASQYGRFFSLNNNNIIINNHNSNNNNNNTSMIISTVNNNKNIDNNNNNLNNNGSTSGGVEVGSLTTSQ